MLKLIILLKLLYLLELVMADMPLAQTIGKQPKISCPQYFSYVRSDMGTIGKVTFNFMPPGTHIIRARFSQTPPAESPMDASLSLYHTEKIVEGRLQRGEPISFRVRFPTPGVLPKVIYIAMDDRVVCRDTRYPEPSSTIELEYMLTTSRGKSITIKQKMLPPEEIQQSNPFQNFDFESTTQRKVMAPSSNTPFRKIQPKLVMTNVFLKSAFEEATKYCGREGNIDANPSLVPLILGGNDIEPGQFPWLAAILHPDTHGSWDFRCGGTLITSRLVLTAAHCLVNTNNDLVDVRVQLGRHNINLAQEDGEVDVETIKTVVNPEYLKRTFPDADVGIVVLQKAVQFTQRISPICLWNGPNELNRIAGDMAVVVGWGIDESGVHSDQPKMITVPIASELECRKNHPSFFSLLTERTLCAGRLDGTGPQQGDSGGALMIKSNDRWMLRGVVSVGINKSKNENHTYVIYCDVAKYTTWIRAEIDKFN